MKIIMQEGKTDSQLTFAKWEVAIIGKPVDDRGKAAIGFLQQNADELFFVGYDPEEFRLDINGTSTNAEEIASFLAAFPNKSVVLEASTLGFVEILLCCRELKNLEVQNLELLYVEPQRYHSPQRSQLLDKRDFDLSDEVPGYRAIPGVTFMLNDRDRQKGVFFLGYEETRFDRALEDYQMIRPSDCIVVFGVPAFQPGWEMDSFANNIRVIRQRNIEGGVFFCGAENPASTVDLLNILYGGLDQDEMLFIAPIGTKPNGIGVALFASTHDNIGILYDHPKRSQGRSNQVSRWHLFSVTFD